MLTQNMKLFIAVPSMFAVLAPRIAQANPFNIFLVVPSYGNAPTEWVYCQNTREYNCDCLVNKQQTVIGVNDTTAIGAGISYFQVQSICGSAALDFYTSNYDTMHEVYIHGADPPQLVTMCNNEAESHDCAAVSVSYINSLECGLGVC
jgi:hypothetical protein